MQARYFRYLFENTEDGIIQSGCIFDRYVDEKISYLYLAGSCYQQNVKKSLNQEWNNMQSESVVDILVLGSVTIPYIKLLTKIISNRYIKTIILPYLTPVQRLVIANWMVAEGKVDRHVLDFLKEPYQYLQKSGIENIYMVYGNGRCVEEDIDDLIPGHHFEMADHRVTRLVEEIEGKFIPVVKAGYIVDNNWFFYFGFYGEDIEKIVGFTRSYTEKRQEKVGEHSDVSDMKKMLVAYAREFGVCPDATITMFQTPQYAVPKEIDSLLVAKTFSQEQRCQVDVQQEGNSCALRCIYQNDYSILKKHKNAAKADSKFGIFLTGNVNLNRYLPELKHRYWQIRNKIRALSLPNCGVQEYWNKKLLDFLTGDEIKYVVCQIQYYTGDKVIREVVISDSRHRLININNVNGYCFSGFLMNKTE